MASVVENTSLQHSARLAILFLFAAGVASSAVAAESTPAPLAPEAPVETTTSSTTAIPPAVDTERLDQLISDLYPSGTPVPREVWQPVNMDAETSPSEHVLGTLEPTTATTTTALQSDLANTTSAQLVVRVRPTTATAAMAATTASMTATTTTMATEDISTSPSTSPTPAVDTAVLPVAEPAVVPVALNTAAAAELAQGLGIDAERARLIIEFRNIYGPFRGPEDLKEVSGINDDLVLRWEAEGRLNFE